MGVQVPAAGVRPLVTGAWVLPAAVIAGMHMNM